MQLIYFLLFMMMIFGLMTTETRPYQGVSSIRPKEEILKLYKRREPSSRPKS